MLTLAQLQACMPMLGARANDFLPFIDKAIALADATTRQRLTMFLATVAYESDDLRRLDENTNYSADGLANTWPTRFAKKGADGRYLLTTASTDFGRTTPAGRKVPNDLALSLHRQPEAIANSVYALRGGNGDEKSGDGWRYRGAGAIQLTFKANQHACAAFFGKRDDEMYDWLRSPEGALMSAAWFWKTRGCNDYADHDDFDGVCDVVNIGRKTSAQGDALGFVNRLVRLRAIQNVIRSIP